jgi:putative oxidoreductase
MGANLFNNNWRPVGKEISLAVGILSRKRMSSDCPDKYRDYGLLVLRLGIGLMFVLVHGLPKVRGGIQMWTSLGRVFNRIIGVEFIPAFWGFMATLSEFGGGICLLIGILFRPACALMLFTMLIVVIAQFRGGYGFSGASQALELGSALLSLLLTGPGKLVLPNVIERIRSDKSSY